ncbi:MULTISPECIES: LysR family transcriptional regulator [Pseudomonas aeruginosa group]|uniref:LysR family transcriptional regulator n=1 Tax=Pseudomonas nitroreducens TaxID=46680 RepID=A0A6G6ISP3_PSENT|nr:MULTISPECIES: LysR family transcriptional regulator [Pseudomonas aeruginosa group]KYO75097.1 HTH-type transcriptional regulator LeuO [Pseudomonas aeruginosa]QIE85987.1 LysR family transcriptional regulator [Pseudomonas nitroreducens]HCE6396363.1 LysR family transcriptional regulator [Pseudomonas aeruginosa]
MTSLRNKNLNLIPILQALLREGSVARAAEQVCLSPPAMSGALARLRELMDDPLLVRVGRSMQLTPRAEKLRSQLDQICADIEHLFEPDHFDPSTAQEYFVIAAPDYLVFLLSGALLPRLRQEAPGVRIRFVDVPIDLPKWLEDSTIDLAVCGNFATWPELKFARVFQDRIVVTVAKDHPLTKRTHAASSAELLDYPSLNYTTGVTSSRQDIKPHTGIPLLDWLPQISTGQFMDAVLLATEPNFVARAPVSLVKRLGNILPLAIIELEGEKTDIDTGMFWSEIKHNALEHAWLRSVVKESLETLLP